MSGRTAAHTFASVGAESTDAGGLRSFFHRHRARKLERRLAETVEDSFARGSFLREHVALPLAGLGQFTAFSLRVLASLPSVFYRRARFREMIQQLDSVGVGALPITHLTGLISGLLLGLQTRVSLEQFGITSLFPQMLCLALVREVGPTFVALVAGARAASGITSELATMAVTQQVDAMRALRRDPIQALAAPRTIASIFAFPILSTVGVLAGFFGGMLIGKYALGQSPTFFFNQAFLVLGAYELIPNLIVKPAAFGMIIGLVSSFLGLRAEGGTRAVGAATVQAVVVVTVSVLFTDYTIGELFRKIWPPPPW